ncbi:MAG TPA: UDP-N-acetylglucosamine--N-acetylmuramyl-(pentapeptide) pyrophosphoryl-undecaprenol N-acetylglucosamine transferase [Patescibacteria group bacterium]|nr:UDP-N-acetylglucosamine--N-acetylmuramyl-(pentapeptide) pyrophosphoryl-undecaprenol N-acetylglucosamine transferase [Patescibacteria group bacterium]
MIDAKIRIVLTGGHAATPGIAVVEELMDRFGAQKVDISWIGSKTAIEGSKILTIEYKIYPKIGVKFYSIKAGKLQTKFTRHTISSFLRIPYGFIQAFFILLKIKPKVILSFGGYAAFPVVFCGWLLNIPVIIHEQTSTAGRSNLASVPFVNEITLARVSSEKMFNGKKTTVIGNPIMSSVVKIKPKTKLNFLPKILVMGGSRGSEFINEEVYKILPKLMKEYKVVHITGERDFERYKSYENSNYQVLPFVDPLEISKYYEMADLIISRSGANTVSEILITKIPSILIPLPRTYKDEQVKNAESAQDFGIAKMLLEKEVTEISLLGEVKNIFENWSSIVKFVSTKKSPDVDASKKLVEIVSKYI